MSDEKLRELERRFKETGSVEDEAAFIVGRVRTGDTLEWASYWRLSEIDVEFAADYLRRRVEQGDLSPDHLTLAACFDHRPAKEALSRPGAGKATIQFGVELLERLAGVRGVLRLCCVVLQGAVSLLPEDRDSEVAHQLLELARAQLRVREPDYPPIDLVVPSPLPDRERYLSPFPPLVAATSAVGFAALPQDRRFSDYAVEFISGLCKPHGWLTPEWIRETASEVVARLALAAEDLLDRGSPTAGMELGEDFTLD